MLSNLSYYIICSSTIMLYGIGLGEAVALSGSPRSVLGVVFKSLFCTTSSTVLTWLLCTYLLCPYDLYELFPFFCAIIFLTLSVFTEILVRITAKVSTTDWTLSMLSTLLAVNEGATLLEALLICIICILSFFVITALLGNIRRRLGQMHSIITAESLMFISIAVILLSTLAWNASWLNLRG